MKKIVWISFYCSVVGSCRTNQSLGFVSSVAIQVRAAQERGMAQKLREDLIDQWSMFFLSFEQ